MDPTAYPHIMESIIAQCGSASTLLALRAASKLCRDLVDARLFHHAVFRAEEYTPKPKGTVRELFDKLSGKKPPPSLRYAMTLPPSSAIAQDVAQLPLLPRKVCILDLFGPFMIDYESTYTFIQLGFSMWDSIPPTQEPAPPGVQVTAYEPLVLRRMGAFVDQDWEGVRDTSVDFVHLGHDGPVEMSLPVRAARYILHVDWQPDGDGTVGLRFRKKPSIYLRLAIPEAFLVLSPHCGPVPRDIVSEVVVRASAGFMYHMVLGETAFTVVGLESWLPDVDAQEFNASIRDDAIWSYRHHMIDDNSVRVSIRDNYKGPRFITFEEWLGSLGEMKDVVGVWPDSEINYTST